MSARIRAFFVLGALCAVTMGLLAPAFSWPMKPMAGGHGLECPHHFIAKDKMAAAHDSGAPHAPRGSGLPGCPDCCLAAGHFGKVVLAFRSSSLERRVASRIRYADHAASAVKPVAAEAANGARAPPTA